MEGFAVPLADTRHFFRFVYSVVASSDDDVRRDALERNAPAAASRGRQGGGSSPAGADRLLRAAAATHQAGVDVEEAAAALASAHAALEGVSRRVERVHDDASMLEGTWTGKLSDYDARQSLADEAARLRAQE